MQGAATLLLCLLPDRTSFVPDSEQLALRCRGVTHTHARRYPYTSSVLMLPLNPTNNYGAQVSANFKLLAV